MNVKNDLVIKTTELDKNNSDLIPFCQKRNSFSFIKPRNDQFSSKNEENDFLQAGQLSNWHCIHSAQRFDSFMETSTFCSYSLFIELIKSSQIRSHLRIIMLRLQIE